jgi:hypothetical protein
VRGLKLLVALGLALVACQRSAQSVAPDASRAAAAVEVTTPAELPDVLKAPRPKGGEHLGLYLMGKKVGYIFSDVKLVPGSRVESVAEFVFKANVGAKTSERHHREVRTYEAKPGGRLLSFVVEQKGDGGDQTLEAAATPTGLRVVRKRPGQPHQVLNLPPSKETVDDADQARVALLRGTSVEGAVTDGHDLESYKVSTTLGGEETRVLGGVKVKLRKAITLSQKEKVPVEAFIDEEGAVVELQLGPTMRAVAESESVAKRLDQVEVFGLTRVVLPKKLGPEVKQVPGSLTLVVTGLPEKFHRDTYRQKFKPLGGDKVEVKLIAAPFKGPSKPRPLADPAGGANLKSSIIVEADNPEIKALAAQVAGSETDAHQAAKKINEWVFKNLVKDYGASADRASDVLRQRRGDCTEHSLLAVAMMRSLGIPAKRVDGVIYMVNDDQVPALYWHEWIEAYVGEWVQMDPTFGQEVADATHFAVGEEGNAEITPLIGLLKVLEVR